MNALADIRSGFDHALHSISEGWQQLRSSAANAVTRFMPAGHRDSKALTVDEVLEANASHWGLLAAEVHEGKESVTVRLEIPGMEADDFDIQVVGEHLVVKGEKRAQAERSHGQYNVMECAYGSFERVIPLGTAVQDQDATARYRRGVLTVVIPRPPKTAPKLGNRIRIE